ncbi:glycosyltransferase family 4 protein [Arthrospiribacter ruber]|uniref:Glycosyltransferase family 1 protein n=1 Tax=Arthrospiribacter ruber TaxID=2487934 RepID=A0A951ITL2_9BACT|nr:glycosyltransferase family 4 protein [Arthrospiribacter ruber]MBW3466372.1 glycosyltransferase family 1 protein [Arthrospiribacter ruber]
MHIVFLTNEYPLEGVIHGGVGTFLKLLCPELARRGHEVTVLGLGDVSQMQSVTVEGVKVITIPFSKTPKVKALFNFKKINKALEEINRQLKIDVVEGPEMSFSFIRKIPGVTYLIRMNGGHHFFSEAEKRRVDRWKAYQEKRSFENADAVCGVSNYVMEHTKNYIDFSEKQGPVIFNPANFTNFYKADPEKAVSGRLFFAGTICEKKGVRQIIKAFHQVKRKFPHTELYLAGRDWTYPDGSSYTEKIKEIIEEEIKSSIHFLGVLPNLDVPQWIESSEICVYPSHMEAMPLAWIEVMSMGKPFVATKIGPAFELVDDGVSGLLADPLDHDELASKIMEILSDEALKVRLGENARKKVLKEFSLETIADQSIAYYSKLVQNKQN